MTPDRAPGPLGLFDDVCARVPIGLISLIARVSLAATFWRSGQTKVSGFAIDLAQGRFELGWPHLSDTAVDLFRTEYQLPLVPPELAAPMAALAEHVLPILILIGLATRASAAGLLVMTLVIEIFVYPDAFPLHGAWAVCALVLMKYGAGPLSLDRWLSRRKAQS